ncbi:MAG: hypothetical protein AABW46_01920, partial [Nanoarchaeota archaeon]
YLQPSKTCSACWEKRDLRGLSVVKEFYDYQSNLNEIFEINDVNCCECNYNGIQDTGEEGIDCGGACPTCEVEEFIWPKCKLSLLLFFITGVLLVVQFYFRKLDLLSSILIVVYAIIIISLNDLVLYCNVVNLSGLIIILQQIYTLLFRNRLFVLYPKE